MCYYHSTVSSLEIEKRWVEEEIDTDDNISCQTGAATVVASNKLIATVSHYWNSSFEQRKWRHEHLFYFFQYLVHLFLRSGTNARRGIGGREFAPPSSSGGVALGGICPGSPGSW